MFRDYKAPINLMAFDRPQYFEKVLQSLIAQKGISLSDRRVSLFQDGSLNPFSGVVRGSEDLIQKNIKIFQTYFPSGNLFSSNVNLGVALNFDRAERHVFEEMNDDACIFLEDDMVLSPYYISILDRLIELALNDSRIGYVAAYGDHTQSVEKQRVNAASYIMLRQNWAFGLTRTQWLKSRPFVEQYLSIVSGDDYSRRDDRKVYDLYSSWGMDRSESSQDRAKLNACTLTGGLRVNTSAVFAQYIGRIGLHSYEELFVKSGFDKTELYPDDDITFRPITDEIFERLFADQRRWVIAPRPLLNLNTPLMFGLKGNGLKALRQSFYAPEPWGVWSAGKQSEISLQIPHDSSQSGALLEITLRHFVPKNLENAAIEVFINHQLVANVNASAVQQLFRIDVPAACIGPQGHLDLRFESPFVGSPQDYSMGEDRRVLSIGIGSITLLDPR